MKQPLIPHPHAPLVGAACVLLAATAVGYAVLGLGPAIAVYVGVAWRSQPNRRPVGTLLAVIGALAAASLVLFSTGYKSGKALAERDNARAAEVSRSGPEA